MNFGFLPAFSLAQFLAEKTDQLDRASDRHNKAI